MIFAPKNEERSELITFVRVFIAPYNGEPRDTRHQGKENKLCVNY